MVWIPTENQTKGEYLGLETKYGGLVHRIQKLTNDRQFIASCCSKGTGDGQFNQHEGTDLDPLEKVVIVDTGNNLYYFSIGTNCEAVFSLLLLDNPALL